MKILNVTRWNKNVFTVFLDSNKCREDVLKYKKKKYMIYLMLFCQFNDFIYLKMSLKYGVLFLFMF